MSRKLEIGIALAGVVIGAVAWLFPMTSMKISGDTETEPTTHSGPFYKALLPDPTLLVSGTGARVTILIGPDNVDFSGGKVSKTGTENTFYIKRGQKINLEITGTGARVFVQSGLLPYININNTATGGSIYEI